MLEFAHVLAGATIAYKIQNPLFSLPLALISHFLVDLLPHWNPRLDEEKNNGIKKTTFIFILLDSFIGLFLGLFIAFLKWPNFQRIGIIILGAFLAVLPDLIEAPFYFFGYQNKLIAKVLDFQKTTKETSLSNLEFFLK